jgi:hypothetical protein
MPDFLTIEIVELPSYSHPFSCYFYPLEKEKIQNYRIRRRQWLRLMLRAAAHAVRSELRGRQISLTWLPIYDIFPAIFCIPLARYSRLET